MDEIIFTDKVEMTSNTREAGRKLMVLVMRHKSMILGGVLCTVVMSLLTSASILIVRNFIDKALVGKDLKMLGVMSGLIVLLFLVRWPFAFFSTYLTTYGGMKVVEDMRNKCYESLQSMSYGFFEKRRTGDLLSRISNDTSVVQLFVTSGISEILRIPIGIITSLSVAIYLSAKLTLIAMLVLPVIAGIIAIAGKRMKKVSMNLQEKIGELNVVLAEILSSMHVVKAFSMEDYETKKFAQENRETVRATVRQVAIRAGYSPMVELIGALGLAVILWVGGRDVILGTKDFITGLPMTAGGVLAIFFALQQIFTQVNRINHVNLALQHAFASAERTFEIIEMEQDISQKPDAVEIPEIHGNIEYRDVHFEYNPGEPVLKGLSVKVEPGMVVALVGSSGSGKSTFVKLLPRFYDVTGGSITIEGIDIRDAKIPSFRRFIGTVPQDTILFRSTIKENIAYGRMTASDEEIVDAAKAAYAHEFITAMPDGYDTMVGERGITLSGGQKQRIAIARAILMDPRILILDEATSNVDNVSEQYIQRALEHLMKNRTTLVIAHRLTTIKNADVILVMDNGRIVERGKHDDLYSRNGTYTRLYDLTLQGDGEE